MRRLFATLAIGCMFLIVPVNASVASAHEAIGPHQHFAGLVNGSNDHPVVYTVCPGPMSPGRTGPVAGGQTLSVAKIASGKGYTGLFSQVYAWLVPTTTGTVPTQVKFTVYGAEQAMPKLRVPCDGTGAFEFSSCPYLAPCAAGWVPDRVAVRFVDIAV
jgi:hypothetical protein